jgi:hypothetical protein
MKIANIIYEKELVNHTQVEYVNYYNKPIECDKLDKTLPTLYVGWSFMKTCNPNNELIQHADILKKRIITNELYWEFCFEESKASHVKGIESFVNLAPNFYFQPKYVYINFDPVFFQIVDVQGLFDALPKNFDFVYVLKNEMIYALFENKIWGINLLYYDYFKFDVTEIKTKLFERTKNFHDDSSGETHLQYYKLFPNFNFLKRFIVTILNSNLK